MARPGVMLYFDQIMPAADRLDDRRLGLLIRGLMRYARDGEMFTSDDLAVQLAFDLMKSRIDADAERYARVSEKKSLAGQASARTRRAK